jgi:hypothetical protein
MIIKPLIFQILSRTGAFLEKQLIKTRWVKDSPWDAPIFIIGPPRSGTTLLYQLLTAHFNVTYPSNFASRFPDSPALATWITHRLWPHPLQSDYHSEYGRISGRAGPHEGGNFWYRWFPRGDHVYVPAGQTSPEKLRELRSELLAMGWVANKPVVIKNTYNSMRIAPIINALPKAIFLVLERDPIDIAQSILIARCKVNGNPHDWWALPPKEIDEIRSQPYWRQIPGQIYYIYRQIEADQKSFGEGHFYSVEYRKLCQNTHVALEDIQRFIQERGVELQLRNPVPAQFPFSTGRRVSLEDYERLRENVEALWIQSR